VQRSARAREQLAAALEVERRSSVAAVGQAAPRGDQAAVAQLAQVVGDEALRLRDQRAQLAHAPVAARQLAQQPPAQRLAGEPQEAGRRTVLALDVSRRELTSIT
jgi:hypothetical protein